MAKEELTTLIELAQWRQTTYIEPHEYILQHAYPELFQRLATLIQQDGYYAKFQGRTYRYFDIGPYKYWRIQNVLNRALLPDQKAGLPSHVPAPGRKNSGST